MAPKRTWRAAVVSAVALLTAAGSVYAAATLTSTVNPDPAPGLWSVTVTAVAPEDAQYVELTIATDPIGGSRDQNAVVDDVHLFAIDWEPAAE